jgi:predicted metal-binding protein
LLVEGDSSRITSHTFTSRDHTYNRKKGGGVMDPKEVCDLAKTLGAESAKEISPETITISEWVRTKCLYGCSYYSRCYTCPPFSPSPEVTKRIVGSYSKAILIHSHHSRVIRELIPKLERAAFLEGYYKAFGLSAGPCKACETCDTSLPCKHPDIARPSMEACGIDVFQTARTSGFTIDVIREKGEERNYFGLLLLD